MRELCQKTGFIDTLKKVRITINVDSRSPGRTLLLFNDQECAFEWHCEAWRDEDILLKLPSVEEIVLLPHQFIEAEWLGCEYTFDGSQTIRLDLVRLVRANEPGDIRGMNVSIHYGWTCSTIIPFLDGYIDDDIVVKRITEAECFFALDEMFGNNEEQLT